MDSIPVREIAGPKIKMYVTPQIVTGGFPMGCSSRTVPPYWNRLRYPSPSYLGASRGLGSLAAITADDAAKQIFPNAPRSPNAGHNMATFDQMVAAAQAGKLNAALPAMCSGGRPPGMVKPVIANTAGGIAMSFVPAAFAAGPIVGGIVLAGAAIAKVFGFIFGHHAAAIRKEQSILCAAIPAARAAPTPANRTSAVRTSSRMKSSATRFYLNSPCKSAITPSSRAYRIMGCPTSHVA